MIFNTQKSCDSYFYPPSWCVRSIPNNIKEIREEKFLKTLVSKHSFLLNTANESETLCCSITELTMWLCVIMGWAVWSFQYRHNRDEHTHVWVLAQLLTLPLFEVLVFIQLRLHIMNTHTQCHLCLLITGASSHTQTAIALTSEVPEANKWWTGLMSHTLFSLRSEEKQAAWNISWEIMTSCQAAP